MHLILRRELRNLFAKKVAPATFANGALLGSGPYFQVVDIVIYAGVHDESEAFNWPVLCKAR